jgi:hypothetical protein
MPAAPVASQRRDRIDVARYRAPNIFGHHLYP